MMYPLSYAPIACIRAQQGFEMRDFLSPNGQISEVGRGRSR
jgi:hypothetical protein